MIKTVGLQPGMLGRAAREASDQPTPSPAFFFLEKKEAKKTKI